MNERISLGKDRVNLGYRASTVSTISALIEAIPPVERAKRWPQSEQSMERDGRVKIICSLSHSGH